MSIHDRRALAHFRPLHALLMGAPGHHPRAMQATVELGRIIAPISIAEPQPRSLEDYVNFLVTALLELLSAAPSIGADFQTAVASWHNAHGDQEKTAAAVSTATQIITAAGALATTLEPPPPPPSALETDTIGH